jgi:mono/diheme cytochrome c family protein
MSRTAVAMTVSSLAAFLSVAAAQTPTRSVSEGGIEYNRDIRPILMDNCFACHGADSAARQADLRLDKRDAAIEMKAIKPGDAAASKLVERITSDDPEMVMPPPATKKQLKPEQKEPRR